MQQVTRMFFACVIFRQFAGVPGRAPDTDLRALSGAEFIAAIRAGRLRMGSQELLCAFGKIFVCRDGTGRGCFPPSVCAPICGEGTCKADATRPCFNDHDCALGVAGSRACPFDDPSPDCFFHEYELQPGIIRSAHLRVDHQGNVWDTAYWGDNSIVRVDPGSPANDYVRLPLPAPNPLNGTLLASAPWDVEVAPNGDMVFSEYMDGAVSAVDVARLADPMVDCTTLQGTPPNDVNPCIRSVNTWFDALHQVHNIDFDRFQNVWFAQAGKCSDPKSTASVGYVKRDFSGYALLPSPTRFSRQMSGVPSCPPGPVEVGFSGSGLSVDPVSHDVWVGETLRRQIGRFSPLAIDLALGQPATQSSTPCFWGICGSADKANDGNIDGAFNDRSVAIAGNVASQAWWQVDLGASSWIEEIELWPRTDPCCTSDLANFKVFVSETPFTSSDPAVVQATPGVTTISEPGVAGRPWSAPVNRTGRWVRVQMPPGSIRGLELAEAVVLGAPLCANDANCNRARGKAATQSSTFSGFAAARAVDGNVDGDINHGSVTHTWSDPNAWWQVDLGQSYDVKDIELWNRTDCPWPCSARLRQFWVFLSDSPFVSTNPAQVQAQPGVTTIYEPGTVGVRWASSVDRSARYVRVQLNGTWQLSLAEVVVAGKKLPRR